MQTQPQAPIKRNCSRAATALINHPQDYVEIYSSYIHFLDIFLQDGAVRTEDPWEVRLCGR